MNRKRTRATLGGLAMLTCAACGGPDVAAFCDAQEACMGGNEADVDACVALYDGRSDMASDLGCTDEYDAYVECAIGHSSCETQAAGGACTTEADCGGGLGGAVRCNGGQCEYKAYGLDEAGRLACETESNAWDHCGGW